MFERLRRDENGHDDCNGDADGCFAPLCAQEGGLGGAEGKVFGEGCELDVFEHLCGVARWLCGSHLHGVLRKAGRGEILRSAFL